jgi:Rad3-related DNA helicase
VSDKQLQSAWVTLNTHVKQLKGIIREQENTIKQLREELAKAKQTEANNKWVENILRKSLGYTEEVWQLMKDSGYDVNNVKERDRFFKDLEDLDDE